MEKLGYYQQITEFSNRDAGSCQWCFATKGGKEYFIKMFLSPKYPANDTMSTPAQIAKRKAACQAFEQQRIRLYSEINRHSDGNAVRVEEFFRVDSRYYMAMPRIKGKSLTIEEISKYNEPRKRQICAIIAHAVATLHNANFVHADIKHSNMLFAPTRNGTLSPKLIDFDAGFMESSPPATADEIGGDQVYFAPETIIAITEGPINLTCKIDVFALGVLFHQYYTGKLPEYDDDVYDCVGDAVLDGAKVRISSSLPKSIYALLTKMLDVDPKKRPTTTEVYGVLNCPESMQPTVPPKPPKGPERRADPPIYIDPIWQTLGDL